MTHWPLIQREHPPTRSYEYDQVPRGRVIYSTRDDTYTVYGSKRFVANETQKAVVLSTFHLPPERMRFRSDEHYGSVPGMLDDA